MFVRYLLADFLCDYQVHIREQNPCCDIMEWRPIYSSLSYFLNVSVRYKSNAVSFFCVMKDSVHTSVCQAFVYLSDYYLVFGQYICYVLVSSTQVTLQTPVCNIQ